MWKGMAGRSPSSPPGFMAATAASAFVRSCCSGVGGFRALKAMGITPGVLHLNEGHSGFAVLEAIATRMQDEGLSLREAFPAFRRGGVHHAHPGARRARPFHAGFD